MAAQKARRSAIAEQKRSRKVLRSHVLPWSVWQERLPSLRALNRQDVRAIAKAATGVFQHAASSTSYVSAVDIYKLRRELRKQAVLKNQLFALRVELIQKTHGWLLDGNGAVRVKNEAGPSIAVESARIIATLSVFEEREVNIEKALSARQLHS
jgi:hypothetical protein